jgi:CHAT domain-containing protein/Tfp pilus assembly protein PilF
MLSPITPAARQCWTSRRCSYFYGLLVAITFCAAVISAQNVKQLPKLKPSHPIEREIAGGAAHSYRIVLAAQQFLYVIVEQNDTDVVVALFAPDSTKVVEINPEVDGSNTTKKTARIQMVAEAAGDYRLEVRAATAEAAAGRYQIKIEELRVATTEDRKRIAAQHVVAEAWQLASEGNAESLRSLINKLHESLPLWRAANDLPDEAKTIHTIGRLYYYIGEEQKAFDYFIQELPLRRAIGDLRGEASALNGVGTGYASSGDTQKALDYYTQALALHRAVGDRAGEAATLNNMGGIYSSLGDKQKALDSFTQALSLIRIASDQDGEAHILHNIGSAYNQLGDIQKALDYYAQALKLRRAIGDLSGEAGTLNSIGRVYYALGEQQKALDYFTEALPLTRTVGNRREEATALNNIGASSGDTQKALDYYTQALALHRAVGDRAGEAATLNNMGGIYSSLGDKQKALDYYTQALALAHAIGDRAGEAITLNNIGGVYNALGEQQKALDSYVQALPLTRAVGDQSGEVHTLYNIARLESNRNNLNQARIQIEEALAIIETLRTKIASHEMRSSYFATLKDHYDLYIDILMRLHKQQPNVGYDGRALQASERDRARSLLELLAEAGADIRQGVDPQLVERERAFQHQLNAAAWQQLRVLRGEHLNEEAVALSNALDALMGKYQQVETEIRQTSPRYAHLTQPQPLTLAEIQTQVLEADTLLLEYSLGTDRSYLWAVTPTSITSYELPKRAEIEAAAVEFYESVHISPQEAARRAMTKHQADDESRQQAQAQSEQAAAKLSRMLLAPAAALLGKKRLLIVADGALQYVPFAALPAPSSVVSSIGPAPLIIDHEVVNLPSASTLDMLRHEAGERKRATKLLAVLADPVFERMDERFTPSAGIMPCNTSSSAAPAEESRGLGLVILRAAQESGVAEPSLRIPRLCATRREADAISALVASAVRLEALDFAANRATATDPALADYRYVHFATHGLLDSQHPELSGLLLSMFDEQGRAQDGFLRMHEVFNLKLNADVVVLSACQTGLGKDVRGEGLVGLTRGFMYAGAPRVVVSLWSVDDPATAELMTRFYRGMLVEKLRPAQALRAAQVSMLRDKRFAAPFYWAAFTLQGEWR